MPNQKISELSAIVTIDNSADVLPIVDTSATTTKKVTPTQLKTSLALNNVDNTSDANKPISSATQTALDAKQATLVSGTNIKTINSTSLLGSGDITISASPSGVSGAIQFSNGSVFASDAANLFWDDTNNRLGVGLNNPSARVDIKGVGTTSATTALSVANSAGTLALQVLDDSRVVLGNSSDFAVYSGSAITARYAMSVGTTSLPTATLQVKSSGSTSATTSLLVQNSGGTELLKVSDNGDIATYDIIARSIYSRASTLDLRGNASGSASSVSLQGFVSGLGWLSMFTAESGKDFGQIPRGAVVNGTTIDASAIFQVDSTTKGFLPPRMTTTQKNAITAVAGLVVYDSTTNKLCCYNGSTWNDLF